MIHSGEFQIVIGIVFGFGLALAFILCLILLRTRRADSVSAEPAADFQMSQILVYAREEAERLGFNDLSDALSRVTLLWAMGSANVTTEILDDLLGVELSREEPCENQS